MNPSSAVTPDDVATQLRRGRNGRRWGKTLLGGKEAEITAFVLNKLGNPQRGWIVGPNYDDGEKEFRVISATELIGRAGAYLGGTFVFAENMVNLNQGQIARVDAIFKAGGKILSTIRPGNYAGTEWCGACFHEKWMFVNLQSPGITLAITGPWDNGAL